MSQLKQIIEEYEKGEVSYDQAKTAIFNITGKLIDQHNLDNYWTSEDLETFVRRLTRQPVADWQQIDDGKAIVLIEEILQNVEDTAILDVNGQALEKRYGKPEGTVSDYIFEQNITEPEQLLEELRKDTRRIL